MTADSNRDEDCPEAALADLADVFADDELIDRFRASRYDVYDPIDADPLASGAFRPSESTSDELVAFLSDWRADVLAAPIPAVEPTVVPIEPAAAPAPRLRPHRHRRSMRSAFAVSAAFVGLLLGSTVVSAREAQPGDLLFGVANLVWPQEAAEAAARLDFQGSLRTARSALDAGSRAEAEAALARAEQAIGSAAAADQVALKAQLDNVRSQLVHPAVVINPGDNGQIDSRRSTTPRTEIPVVVAGSDTARAVPYSAEPELPAVAVPTLAEQPPASETTVSSVVEFDLAGADRVDGRRDRDNDGVRGGHTREFGAVDPDDGPADHRSVVQPPWNVNFRGDFRDQ